MSLIEKVIPTVIGAAGSILQNQIQNYQSKENIEHAAKVNYGYGEMAAGSADARTRALYSSLYSPEAKVKQLKNAGLSVGLMYGQGGAGGSGIIVIRYPSYLKAATSATGSPQTYISGAWRVYVWTSSGSITF